MYYVYIIKCTDNTLYTGITTDLVRRLSEHFGKTEKCAKYTRSHQAVSIEAVWTTENRSLASKLEYKIKQLTKLRKLKLIDDNEYLKDVVGEDTSLYLRCPLSFLLDTEAAVLKS